MLFFRYKNISILAILILLISSSVFAQQGFFHIKNFEHQVAGIDNRFTAIVQDKQGIMHFAHRKGVLHFDGLQWNITYTPSPVYAVGCDAASNQLFVAAKYIIGYIQKDEQGIPQFTSIDFPLASDFVFTQVEVVGGKAYFFGENMLIEYDITTKKVSNSWETNKDYEILTIFKSESRLFVELTNKGVFTIEGKNFKPTGFILADYDEVVIGQSIPQTEECLVVSIDNKILIFNQKLGFVPLKIDDYEYLIKSEIIGIVPLNKELAVFATLRGGSILVNIRTGKTIQYINYQTGLPDNEIFAIGYDSAEGIWIAHQYGISRADYTLPFSNFSHFSGLEGNVLDVKRFNTTIYVATSAGVFFLEEMVNISYRPEAPLIRKKIVVPIITNTIKVVDTLSSQKNVITAITGENQQKTEEILPPQNPTQSIEKEDDNFFKRMFKRKQKRNQRNEENATSDNTVLKEQEKKMLEAKAIEEEVRKELEKKAIEALENRKKAIENNRNGEKSSFMSNFKNMLIKKTQEINTLKTDLKATEKAQEAKRKLAEEIEKFIAQKTVKYAFKKVNGIEGKARQLLVVDNTLFSATNAGLYLIKGSSSEKISNEPITHMASPSAASILATTNGNAVVFIMKQGQKWILQSKTGTFSDRIGKVAIDAQHNWWVCGTDNLYKVRIQEDFSFSVASYALPNRFMDEILPMRLGNEMYFFFAESAFRYDESKDIFALDTAFAAQFRQQKNLIWYSSDVIWQKKDKMWKNVGITPIDSTNLIYLNAFMDIENIIPDTNKRYVWVALRSGGLFLFDTQNTAKNKREYKLSLYSVQTQNGNLLNISKIRSSFEENTLTFQFFKPDYLMGEEIEYQYILVNEMEEWSEWSTDNSVVFHALQSGSYRLRVRSRDVLGNMQEHEEIKFIIRQPYWKTAWFYGIEIMLLLGLVVTSALLNRNKTYKNSKTFSTISKMLYILTLIVCMEFLKVTFESFINLSGSPVIDFGVEVFLALLIFPFERILSYIILRFRLKEIQHQFPRNQKTSENS